MSDVFSKSKRSEVMRSVLGKGNRSTEERLRQILRANSIHGWRRGSTLPGKPDFVFSKTKLAVFVDGCFWHGCPKHASQPKNRATYWKLKLAANAARDRKVNRLLRERNWKVFRIWEHELHKKTLPKLIARIQKAVC